VWQWIELDTMPQTNPFFVHTDELSEPLKHPVNGKTYTSKAKYVKDTQKLGLEIVGEEKLSQKPRQLKDKITEKQVLDAMERAEAIHSDPAKRNEWRNRVEHATQTAYSLLYGKK